MRSGLFFLSVGLLALGANLPGTPGQKDTEKPPSDETVSLRCMAKGVPPDSSLSWFRNEEAVPASIEDNNDNDDIVCSILIAYKKRLKKDFFTCLLGPGQETQDKDSGHSASDDQSVVTLSCTLKGPHPPGVDIGWEEDHIPLPEEDYETYERTNFIGSTLILPYDALFLGSNYSCVIGQQGLYIGPP